MDKSGSWGVVWVGAPPCGQRFQERGCRRRWIHHCNDMEARVRDVFGLY